MISDNNSDRGSPKSSPSARSECNSPPSYTFKYDYATEGQWRGPFWFLQAADTQLGMIDSFTNKSKNPNCKAEIELCQKLIALVNSARPKPRFIILCGDLVDAWPRSSREGQVREFNRLFSHLDRDVRLFHVAGNHDVDDRPSPITIEEYRRDFAPDYYSFWLGGVKFVVINSQYHINDTLVKRYRQEQDQWLDSELRRNHKQPWKHLIGFQHIPPFLRSSDELPVYVPGYQLPFNYTDLRDRTTYLTKLKKSGMGHLFCGHYHRNAGGRDGSLEVVVTTAVGCQLGSDPHGFRSVVVTADQVYHTFHDLTKTQMLDISINR